MLSQLHLRNLTAFRDVELKFGKNLNVIVGENGVGKSHILKAAYCGVSVLAEGAKKAETNAPETGYLKSELARKFKAVFRPDRLGRLATKKLLGGDGRCEVAYEFAPGAATGMAFSFTETSDAEVELTQTPQDWATRPAVFLPTRELLTLQPQFIPMYDEKYLPFEETWRDTSQLLTRPATRKPDMDSLRPTLEKVLGGAVVVNDGRFYLKTASGEFEMYLVAEGLRKIAMIAQLISTGALTKDGYLFWDEPEANLNPKTIKLVAEVIVHLAQAGVQVFVATHSLFLLKELYILQSAADSALDTRYFGLNRDTATGAVSVSTAESLVGLHDVAALDEDIAQCDRFLNEAIQAAKRDA